MELDAARAGTQRLRLRLTPDVGAPAAARRALRDLPLGERADDVLLLASELVTNAVVHAGLAPDQPIELAVASDGGRTRVEVRDAGGGFTPEGTTEGFGLRMVAEAAERWGVERDGSNCVWFELAPRAARAGERGARHRATEVGRGGFEPPSVGL